MTPTRIHWANKTKAIDASKELSNELKRTIYVKAHHYGFHPYNSVQYVLQTDDQVMDFKSKNIVHIQQYQPGKESEKNNKNILEILEQKGEK